MTEKEYQRAIKRWVRHYDRALKRAIKQSSSGDYILALQREKNNLLARITEQYHAEQNQGKDR